jgi:Fe-S cluster assembly iron-binding protein IscA
VLSLTPSAAEMIAHLTDQAELPDGGLRIADDGPKPGLTMSVVPRPAADDLVVLQHQVAVYLDPIAAERLSTETLDARSGEAGAAFFLEP